MSMHALDELADDGEVMSEINMTPLVDVMLVLLIIFIVTIPVITDAIHVQLPQLSSAPDEPKPESINLTVDANGQIYWGKQASTLAQVALRLKEAAQQDSRTALHVRADKHTPYEYVAQVLAAGQHGGISRISLATEPE